MEEIKKKSPRAPWFSSQYSNPFHQDTKRLERVDFTNFDPYVPENRQVVANCKKHRRQRHNLSDKCKSVLSIIDFQERLLSVEGAQIPGQPSQAGVAEVKADILIRFGNGIPEISKEYIKHWISSSGIVQEPYSREYDVHTMDDSHKHKNRFTVILNVPFFRAEGITPEETKQIIEAYMENPEGFEEKFKVKPVYLYGRNKVSGEDDAFGVDIEGVPGPIAIVEGRDVKPINKANVRTTSVYDPEDKDFYNRMTPREFKHYIDYQEHERANPAAQAKETREEEKRVKEESKTQQEAEENAIKLKRLRQKQILTDLMDPHKYVAPLSVQGGWTNPLGQTLRLLESGGKTLGTIGEHLYDTAEYRNKKEEARKKVEADFAKLMQQGNDIKSKLAELKQKNIDKERIHDKEKEYTVGRMDREKAKEAEKIEAEKSKKAKLDTRVATDTEVKDDGMHRQAIDGIIDAGLNEVMERVAPEEPTVTVVENKDSIDVGSGNTQKKDQTRI